MYYGLINSMKKASASTLWNNLLSYWSGDNTPNDSKGTINGTLVNGATYGTGKINNGFSFDGVNDYVDFGNNFNFDGSTPFSFNFWLNATDLTNVSIMGKWDYSTTGYLFFMVGGKLRVFLANNVGTNILRVETVNSLTTGFKMITITYDGSKTPSGLIIRIDNSIQSVTVINNTLTGSVSTPEPFRIGTNASGLNFFKGVIDEVGVWSKVLNSTEITELYNSGSGKQYPL
jgi:hypothetical protein